MFEVHRHKRLRQSCAKRKQPRRGYLMITSSRSPRGNGVRYPCTSELKIGINHCESEQLSTAQSHRSLASIGASMNQSAFRKTGGLLCFCLILWGCGGGSSAPGNSTQPPPVQSAQVPRSAIKHLMIVVMQNSSFDHLFGKFPGVNGLDSSLPSYHQKDQAGNTISPKLLSDLSPADLNHTATSYQIAYDSGKMDKYALENGDTSMDYYDNTSIGTTADGQQFGVDTLWNYAQQYAIADNFFAAAMASEPSNMLYMTAGDTGTGADPYGYPQLDACTAGLFQKNQGSGANVTPPLTFTNVGDQLSARNISWGFYQEFFSNEQNGTCTHYVPQENPFQYFQTTANSANVQTFT